MTAYVISDVETRDPEAMAATRRLAADSIAVHGGRYVVRGGPIHTLEGGWTPEAIVVVAFDTGPAPGTPRPSTPRRSGSARPRSPAG